MKMIQILAALVIILAANNTLSAQKYATKTGVIRFYSEAPAENIEAYNRQVNSALDINTGDFVFRVLMKGFQFEKALMQEHFNENYVESHKHPNATFIGKISDLTAVDFSKDGMYDVQVAGDLTIKGTTQKISEKGTLEVKDGVINGKSTFYVSVADFDIRIPKAVVKNIAEKIEINVDISLNPLNN